MSDRIKLSSSFTHFVNKCRQAAAYDGVEHSTFKKCSPYASGFGGVLLNTEKDWNTAKDDKKPWNPDPNLTLI